MRVYEALRGVGMFTDEGNACETGWEYDTMALLCSE